jgi:protein gp37
MLNMAMKHTNPKLPGCHGFAFFDDRKQPHWTGKVEFVPAKVNDPLDWKTPSRIFVNSMSDLFHEDLPLEGIQEVFRVMKQAHWHQFQILTKRSKRLAELV